MIKAYLKNRQKVMKYFASHAQYNSVIHVMGGIGIGILITYPLVGPHPIRWAVAFLLIAVLGHLYPLLVKK